MPCHYSKGGEVQHIECPSCGHQFPHEPVETPERGESLGDEAVEEARESESPNESRPPFVAALKRRRIES